MINQLIKKIKDTLQTFINNNIKYDDNNVYMENNDVVNIVRNLLSGTRSSNINVDKITKIKKIKFT